jgi:hypothetical protein
MEIRTPEMIDRHLVHKRNQENVLLADLRLAVPSWLEGKVFADVERRDRAASEVLRAHYLAGGRAGAGGEELFVLAGLEPIARIRSAELERRLSNLPPEGAAELLGLYDRAGDELLLRPDVNERAYERLLIALRMHGSVLSTSAKLRISRALELLEDAPRAYCATLVVDTAHRFFFEHMVEHVPGLLIIEAARQMVVATELKYRGVAADVQFILQAFSAEFQGYLDNCVPVDLYCRETSRAEPRSGRPSCDVHLEVVVSQMHREAARFKLVGETITQNLFERLRRNRTATLGHRVFVPRPHVVSEVVVGAVDAKVGHAVPVALWVDGLRLKLAEPLPDQPGEGELTLSFPELPPIVGRFRVSRQWREDGRPFAEVELAALDKSARLALQKAIALCCVWTGEERPPGAFPASPAAPGEAIAVGK